MTTDRSAVRDDETPERQTLIDQLSDEEFFTHDGSDEPQFMAGKVVERQGDYAELIERLREFSSLKIVHEAATALQSLTAKVEELTRSNELLTKALELERESKKVLETALNNIKHLNFHYRVPPQGMTHSRSAHIAITAFRRTADQYARQAIELARIAARSALQSKEAGE
jgi:hypothetical protein